MVETTSFWWKALRKAGDVLENTGEEILGDQIREQVEEKLQPLLKLLKSPEGRKAFDKAFAEAADAFQQQATNADDRQLRGEIIELLTRTTKAEVDEASRQVLQRYVLQSEPNRMQLDRWIHRQVGGTKVARGERVYEQDEVANALDTFFQELNRAFWHQPLFAQRVSQSDIAHLLQEILDRLPEPPDITELRSDYLDYLRRRYAYLDLGGIAPKVNNRLVKLAMEDIYVPIVAERELDLRQTWLHLKNKLLQKGSDSLQHPPGYKSSIDLDSEKMAVLARALEEEGESQAWRRFREQLGSTTQVQESVTIEQILAEPRAVLLGHPGTGKSTTLRYIAYSLARGLIDHVGEAAQGRVPIMMRLVDYASARSRQGPGLRLRDYLREVHDKDRADLFSHELERGNCLVLLDGLDEIIDAGQRSHVADEVEALVADYPKNYYLVASRIVGYEAGRLVGEFTHFTIGKLPEEAIRDFVQRWYTAIEREGGRDAPVEAEEQAAQLSRVIQSRPGIRRLATNPLLLTIIALLNWKGRILPHRRVEVYRHAAETLVESWPRRMRGVEFDVEEVLALLAPVAFHIFSHRSSEEIAQTELVPLMTEAMAQIKPGIEAPAARDYIEGLLPQLSEHSGIFLERGYDLERQQPVYGFLHLTFAEYLAARYLAGRWEAEKDVVGRRAFLARYAHVPRWREVVLLMVAHVGLDGRRTAATEILSDLLELEVSYENALHRNLLLAGQCLADDLRPEAYAAEWVLQELLQLLVSTQVNGLQEEIIEITLQMRGTIYEDFVRDRLLRLVKDESHAVRGRAAWALGSMGSEEAVDGLLALLDDQSGAVRGRAILALGQIGSERAVDRLLALLDDQSEAVRGSAAWALGEIGSERAVDRLLALLDDQSGAVHGRAAWALGEIGSERAVDRLLALLGDQSEEVRSMAAWALGEIGSERAVDRLLALLDDQSGAVRGSAAEALSEIGGERAVDRLLALLDDQSEAVRGSAAEALGEIGGERAVDGLLALLDDQSEAVRGSAAGALGEIGSERAVDRLLALLDDQSGAVRSMAAWALGEIGGERAVDRLLALLGDQSEAVRGSAAGALGQIGSDKGLDQLLAFLHDDRRLMVLTNDQHFFGELRDWAYKTIVAILEQHAVDPADQQDEIATKRVAGPWG